MLKPQRQPQETNSHTQHHHDTTVHEAHCTGRAHRRRRRPARPHRLRPRGTHIAGRHHPKRPWQPRGRPRRRSVPSHPSPCTGSLDAVVTDLSLSLSPDRPQGAARHVAVVACTSHGRRNNRPGSRVQDAHVQPQAAADGPRPAPLRDQGRHGRRERAAGSAGHLPVRLVRGQRRP